MDPENQTDVTNSEATQTVGDEATTTTTSTTETSEAEGQQQANDDVQADPLDTDAGLGADTVAGDADTTEGGEEGGDQDADAGDQADTTELTGAPEGDYELDVPEGFAIDQDALAEFAPEAKALNLSNKGLSHLLVKGFPLAEKIVSKGMVNTVVETRKAWETDGRAFVMGGKLTDGTEVEASPVFAGENMDAVMATSAKAIDRFTAPNGQPLLFPNAKVNPETGEMEAGTFRDFLKTTGLGNHPAMLFLCYQAGSAISEDSDFERSGATVHTKTTREAKYYPHKQQT